MEKKEIIRNGIIVWISLAIVIISIIISLSMVFRGIISIETAAWYGDFIAGFSAPLVGSVTIYLVYTAYNKQHESHDLQERSLNFQALNQLILELEQQKPAISKIIKMFWLEIYGFNHVTKSFDPHIGARLSIRYRENETEIKTLIAFFSELNFVQLENLRLNIGKDFQRVIDFKIMNIVNSIVLLKDVKQAIETDFTYEIEKVGSRLRAENSDHLDVKQFTILNNKLRQSLETIDPQAQ